MSAEQQKRVLVVDDDAGTRKLLSTVLLGRGLVVDEAGDGQQALDLIESQPYGVIVLDLLMPVIDGFSVVARLSALTPRPVVLVVSGAAHGVVDRLDPATVHGIIRKPFDAEEIADVVAACAEIRCRMSLETMALAMVTGGSLFALLLTNASA
ncbi:MAG TPA: response regulator [Thermoanaerobaculia bacterium]|nr:response regulator [Thermoanaerobaculia bacterium]